MEPEEASSPLSAAPAPPVAIPEVIDVNAFQARSLPELYQLGEELHLRVNSRTKHQLVLDLLVFFSRRGSRLEADGCIEFFHDGPNQPGVLRFAAANFRSNADEIFVPAQFVRQYDLRRGNRMKVVARAPANGRKGWWWKK